MRHTGSVEHVGVHVTHAERGQRAAERCLELGAGPILDRGPVVPAPPDLAHRPQLRLHGHEKHLLAEEPVERLKPEVEPDQHRMHRQR